MLYDESFDVRDGDGLQSPKHGSAGAAIPNRISIKATTPTVIVKQKSATEVHHPASSSSRGRQAVQENLKSDYLRRPSTCINGNNNNNGGHFYENLTGLTRTLETSRPTYRVSSTVMSAVSQISLTSSSSNSPY